MDKAIFYEELKGGFHDYGKVNAAFNNNSTNFSLSVDYIWLTDYAHPNIISKVLNLQSATPLVEFDVEGHRSMSYPLGTTTSVFKHVALKEYGSSDEIINIIEQEADIIFKAHTATIAYDKASFLLNSYYNKGESDDFLIQKAWNELSGKSFQCLKCKQLYSTIKALIQTISI